MKVKSIGKKIYLIHKWCGLFGALFISILGITGSILVFNEEFEEAEHKEFLLPTNTEAISIDKAYATVIHQYPDWDVRLKNFSDLKEPLVFNLRKPTQRLTLFVHPSSGEILGKRDSEKSFIFWILKLHYSLRAKLAGEIVVLVFGVVYLISLITGCIVYRKALADTFLFRVKFRAGNKRSAASTLHRYVGTWALVLNLALVFTGVVISYNIVAKAFKPEKIKTEFASPTLIFSVDQLLKDVKASYPQFKPTYLRFPINADKPLLVSGLSSDLPFYYSRYYNSISADAKTGKLLEVKIDKGNNALEKFLGIVRGIHFLEFANLPLKIVFMLVALSAPLLSITGFLLWFWKSKKNTGKKVVRPALQSIS